MTRVGRPILDIVRLSIFRVDLDTVGVHTCCCYLGGGGGSHVCLGSSPLMCSTTFSGGEQKRPEGPAEGAGGSCDGPLGSLVAGLAARMLSARKLSLILDCSASLDSRGVGSRLSCWRSPIRWRSGEKFVVRSIVGADRLTGRVSIDLALSLIHI